MKYEELAEIFRAHAESIADSGDPTARFRAASYGHISQLIKSNFKPNSWVKLSDCNKLKITDYMKDKIAQAVQRGKLTGMSKSPSKTNLLTQLTGIMGIGQERAKKLMTSGLTNVSQLKLKKYQEQLPDETKLYMKLKPLERIPRDTIEAFETHLAKLINFTIVGSYRRGKPTSGDIDVMLVSKSPTAVDDFHKILVGLLGPTNVFTYSKGPDKLSTVLRLNILLGKKAICKLDAFRVRPEDRIPMLLYSTGSKEFNVRMRSIAKRKGYLLNQNGLFKNNHKVTGLKNEKDYFKILDMAYLEPADR